MKWLLPTWAGCLYQEDRTNRRCSIPRRRGPALGLLQFPVSFPQQKGASGPLPGGSAWFVGTRSKPRGCGHSQAERCLPLGWPWALPGAFVDLTELQVPCGGSHTQLTALTPTLLHRRAADPRQSNASSSPQGLQPRGFGATRAHACVQERGSVHTTGLPATRSTRTGTHCISPFAHRFLLQWLQAWALRLTPREKSSLLGELCTKMKRGSNPQPSPARQTGTALGTFLQVPGGKKGRDLHICGAWWVPTDLSDQHGLERSQGRVSRAEGSRGLWRQQLCKSGSGERAQLCSDARAGYRGSWQQEGSQHQPGLHRGGGQPPARLPSATHLALQLLDELLEPVDLCHPLAVVLDTNTCKGKGREMSLEKLDFVIAKASKPLIYTKRNDLFFS